MAHMIHVLLVEYDNKTHDEIKNMLQYFSYKVSTTKLASTALSMLSKQKDEYDIVMVNMNSPDSYGFQLLQYAVQMDLLVILMVDDDDAVAITRALEQGAFLCAKKPITMETIGYLWQHALREKAYRPREREQPSGAIEYNAPSKEFEEDLIQGNLKGNKNTAEKCKSKKNVNLGSSQHDNVTFRKKVWTEWTQELHEKFMNAITQLGEGRCYPKDILELMNVPGLTRMQVASHLQKCRNAKWQPPNERKSKPTNSNMMLSKSKGSRTKLMRFGSMPYLESSRFHLKIQENHENYCEFTTNSRSQANANENNRIKTSQKRYHHQFFDYGNYLFAQGNETFNMGQFGRTFGMDETFMFGAQSATPSITSSPSQRGVTEDVFEFQNMDTMVQNFSALQQELGLNYNERMQARVSNLSHDQIYTATNGTNQWSREIPKSVINKENKD